MFDADGNLDIFEDFRIDYNLPKHRRDEEAQEGTNVFFSRASGNVLAISNPMTGSSAPTTWTTVKKWFGSVAEKIVQKTQPKPISVEDFFKSVKDSTEELEVIEQRAYAYDTAIATAQACGQTALVERLKHNVVAVRSETQLLSIGLKKYVEEAKLVEFVKKCQKGLRLDWIANFTRFIPKHIVGFKQEADERKIFDNYVILHFDPERKSWAETQAEKDARKDPILFGLIAGRRRLYYVADWVDELCDLTLDKMVDIIGGLDEIKSDSF